MTQTVLAGLWSLLVGHPAPKFERRAISATAGKATNTPDDEEKNRLPERDESFYWGFCTTGFW